MSKALYKNNAESISAAAILATDVAVTLATGDGALFPAPAVNQHAIVTLTDGTNYEIVKVTNNATDVLTIVRAQEGTAALAWASGTTVSQRLTAAVFEAITDLEGVVGGVNQSVQAGLGSTATGIKDTAIGRNCTTSGGRSVAVGSSCTSSGGSSVAIGSNASATFYGSIAIGPYANAVGYSSVAIGRASRTISSYATSLGHGTSALHHGTAIGYACVNTMKESAKISGGIVIGKSKYSNFPHLAFAGAEVVFMTEAMSMSAITVPKFLNLPAGSVFLPTSAGVLVTDQNGVITTQPTVQVSGSMDAINYTPLTAAALTTALVAPRTFQDLAIGAQTNAYRFLKGELTVAGVSTLLYNARFYFKGIFVEE